MQRYFFGVKQFLVANGYTVKGSASAGTGAMDAVDRWASSASVTPRATVAAASQGWIVLVDSNGANILLTYQGATDDIARISFSPGGLFVAAGTANQQPTATDEQVMSTANTLIGSTASADRLWNGWVSSDRKLCRFNIARSGIWVGQIWGVELIAPTVIAPASITPAMWGFSFLNTVNTWASSSVVGFARPVVASVAINASMSFMAQWFFATQQPSVGHFGIIQPEAQGGVGYGIWPLSIGSRTAGATGKLGALYDWWDGRSDAADGDTYGTLEFIAIGPPGVQCIWPWDGVTSPVLT